MKIGNLEIKNGVFLAPMAGVTDRAFRRICAEFGAECVTSEMISAKGLCYDDRKTRELACLSDDIRPAGIQLFGCEEYYMAKAAEKLMEFKPDFFDINMGCPVKKVVSCGEGSAMMKNPEKCEKVVRAVKNAVNVPVTVKIRTGFDSKHINASEVAKYCEQGGASAVTVHGRTREMMYSGKADLNEIARVKKSVSIPVIGNGDVCSVQDYVRMKETGCDGVMIGRGSMGRPWIFGEIKTYINGEEFVPPTNREIAEIILHQLELVEGFAFKEYLLTMRKQISWYTKGISGSADIRRRLNQAVTADDFKALIEEAFCR